MRPARVVAATLTCVAASAAPSADRGAAGEVDAPAAEFDEEARVQPLQRDRRLMFAFERGTPPVDSQRDMRFDLEMRPDRAFGRGRARWLSSDRQGKGPGEHVVTLECEVASTGRRLAMTPRGMVPLRRLLLCG